MKTKLFWIALLILCLLLTGCGGGEDEKQEDRPEDQVSAPTREPRPQRPEDLPTAKVGKMLEGGMVELDDGRQVRLIGINMPKVGQPLAASAANYARSLAEGQEVGLEQGAVPRDVNDVEVFYVWVGDKLLNYEIARAGWGNRLLETPPSQYDGFIQQAEQSSRAEGLGIWQRSAHRLKIDVVQADAPGADEENLNGETVTLRNTGDTEVNMAGFTLHDSESNLFTFAAVTLAPGRSLVVLTGCGQGSANQVYWCSNKPIWDANDAIFLSDAGGLLIDYRSLGGQ